MSGESLVISVGTNGRLLLPATLRKQLSLFEGDRLLVAIEENGKHLKMAKLENKVAAAQGLYSSFAPKSGSIVEELIAERRQQAAAE